MSDSPLAQLFLSLFELGIDAAVSTAKIVFDIQYHTLKNPPKLLGAVQTYPLPWHHSIKVTLILSSLCFGQTTAQMRQRMVGSGAKRKTTATDDRHIKLLVCRDRRTSAKMVKQDLGLNNVHEEAIRRRLRAWGVAGGWSRKKPFISFYGPNFI